MLRFSAATQDSSITSKHAVVAVSQRGAMGGLCRRGHWWHSMLGWFIQQVSGEENRGSNCWLLLYPGRFELHVIKLDFCMHTHTLPCKYHYSHKHTNKIGKESSWSMLIYSNHEMKKTMLGTQNKTKPWYSWKRGPHMEKRSAARKHLSNAILVMG